MSKKTNYLFLAITLLMLGVILISSTVGAQDEVEAEYIGVRECFSCHSGMGRDFRATNHAMALQDMRDDKDGMLGDFTQETDVLNVQFPGEDSSRRLTVEDVAYAMGNGHYLQRYLYERGENDLLVLPVQWNTVTGEWETFTPGGAEEWPADVYDFEENCASCHTTGFDAEMGTWLNDGVQCESCHGPGSNHVDVADELYDSDEPEDVQAIRESISLTQDAQVCGECHNQEGEEFWWPDGHANQSAMQYSEWATSSHGDSLETALSSSMINDDCLQCHSADYRWSQRAMAAFDSGDSDRFTPPLMVTSENAQFGVTCNSCHNPHSIEEYDNLLVNEPVALCLECHSNNYQAEGVIHHPVGEMFAGAPIVPGIEGVESTHSAREGGPDCLTCHMPATTHDKVEGRSSHTFAPVMPAEAAEGQPNPCLDCHSSLETTDLQYLIDDTQDAVQERLVVAWSRFGNTEEPPADTPDHDRYNQVSAALTFVQNDGSMGVHNYKYVDELLDFADYTLSELGVVGGDVDQVEETPVPLTILEQRLLFANRTEPVEDSIKPITIAFMAGAFATLLFFTAVFLRIAKKQEG